MRAALYIDCDSIEAGFVPAIHEEIIRSHELVVSKMFNSDRNDQSFAQIAGKFRIQDCMRGGCVMPAAVVALAVEVMSDELAGLFDKIYIATGDVRMLPLLDRLKQTNADVVVLGPCDADRSLVEASRRYLYLEVLMGKRCTADIPDIADIAGEIYSVSSYYKGLGRDASLQQICDSVARKYPDFDIRNYGYTHLTTFIEQNVDGINIYTDDKGVARTEIFNDRADIDAFAYEYMVEKGYRIDDMAELLEALEDKFPGFAMENYGYHTDYGFILSFPKFEIWENKGIKMKRTFKLSAAAEEKP